MKAVLAAGSAGNTRKGLEGNLFSHWQFSPRDGVGCHQKVLICGRGTFRQSSCGRDIYDL